jgi:hypothetical protein
MAVPQYCRSRHGRVYRVQRISETLAEGRVRYVLRATPVAPDKPGFEASTEVPTDQVRDKIRLGQSVPTPEATFEQLWQQLRLDLDVP